MSGFYWCVVGLVVGASLNAGRHIVTMLRSGQMYRLDRDGNKIMSRLYRPGPHWEER